MRYHNFKITRPKAEEPLMYKQYVGKLTSPPPPNHHFCNPAKKGLRLTAASILSTLFQYLEKSGVCKYVHCDATNLSGSPHLLNISHSGCGSGEVHHCVSSIL